MEEWKGRKDKEGEVGIRGDSHNSSAYIGMGVFWYGVRGSRLTVIENRDAIFAAR